MKKWFVNVRGKLPVRRQDRFRLRVEELENRLTPSSFTAVDFTPQLTPVSMGSHELPAPVPITPNAVNVISPMSTSVSGGYATGAMGGATAEGVAVGPDGTVYTVGKLTDPAISGTTDQVGYVKAVSASGTLLFLAPLGFGQAGDTTELTGIAVDLNGNFYISGKHHRTEDTPATDNGLYLKGDSLHGLDYAFYQPSGPTGGPVATLGVAVTPGTATIPGEAVFVGSYSPTPTEPHGLAARFVQPDPTVPPTQTYGFFYGQAGITEAFNAVVNTAAGDTTTFAGWVNIPGTTTNENFIAFQVDATGHATGGNALTDIGSPTTDHANAVTLDAAGNVDVAGTLDIGGPNQAVFSVQVDPTFSVINWQVAYVGAGGEALSGNGIAVTSTGDVVVAGGFAGSAAFVVLSHVDGSVTDGAIFGGTGGADVSNAVAIRSDGHIFVVGTTNSSDFAPVTDGSTLVGPTDGFITEWTLP
jgi:hypothetical protein